MVLTYLRGRAGSNGRDDVFLDLSTPLLILVLAVLIVGSVVAGLLTGRSIRGRQNDTKRATAADDSVKEASGVLQGTLLGFMALLLAFGLSLALGRYDARRAAVVDDANTIGTAYLRAQTLPEPERSRSLSLIVKYTDVEVRLTHAIPATSAMKQTVAAGSALQRPLWALAAEAVEAHPVATAPRLYEDSLNSMIDQQTVRVAGLTNRVPTEVLLLEMIGAAVAVFLLGLHVGVLGRSFMPVVLAAALVTMLLFVTFDLDRPTRGLIKVSDTPLISLRASMALPPAAGPSS